MKDVCPCLAHTLIVYIFNVFNGFVELAKNPHVIRELKATEHVDIKHVKVPSLIMHQLLEQLQLCIATGSTGILFARPSPNLSPFFFLLLLSAGTVFGLLCRLRLVRAVRRTVVGITMVVVWLLREREKVGIATLVMGTRVGFAVEEQGDLVGLVFANG